jgi:type VI secretion system secreted protein Hcp
VLARGASRPRRRRPLDQGSSSKGAGMGWISGRRAWRVAIAPVVAIALFLGYVSFAHHDTKPARSAHVSAEDLLLAATQARKGISLEYDGITGPPSTNHINHAQLLSFSFGIKRAIGVSPGAGRQAGAPSIGEIRVTKRSDKYSVPLLHESVAGQGSKNAIVYFTNLTAAGVPFDYLEFDMQNVLISSFSFSSGGDVPTEAITFNFTKITVKAHFTGSPQQIVAYDLLAGTVA